MVPGSAWGRAPVYYELTSQAVALAHTQTLQAIRKLSQFEYELSPTGSHVWILSPLTVALLWKDVELLGGRIPLEEVGPWGQDLRLLAWPHFFSIFP